MCLAFSLLFTAPTHATTPSQTHMLVLKCANSESTTFLSRLAVLDIPQSKKMDFALVTGHALPLERPCFVQDFEGNQRDVDLIDYAKAFEVGTPNDWALISFRKMKTKNLVRYPLSPITDYISDFEAADILFAEARGLPKNSQACRLLPTLPSFKKEQKRRIPIFHDCDAIPGQSGSPLTARIEEQDYLVGLHIGRAWFFKSPYTGRADRHGYVALFDPNMVEEINTILSTKVSSF